ncbi:hypothetical protein IWQ62_002970 [Dispira parvispora]|uniref:Thiamin pyrophosphokinase thiamin-binding domain-containing protein n=1 Tax=Dispira parvispora TaxID=1520584 RepID=A0A9W8E7H1_9FUNG|nr:hypothetical protein IWQ62_002970 [Dispira parvispora]
MSSNNPPRPLNIAILEEKSLTFREVQQALKVFQNSPSFQSVSPMISHQVRQISSTFVLLGGATRVALVMGLQHRLSEVILGEPADSKVEGEIPKIALLLLNQPVGPEDEIFQSLWKRADVRICADGAANRLYNAFHKKTGTLAAADAKKYVPTVICGDMDSAEKVVVEYFEGLGTTIAREDDQDTTDFMKCLDWIDGHYEKRNSSSYAIVAYGGLGGRFDHTMASISTLYKYAKDRPIYLVNPGTLTFLLTPNTHHIECQWYRKEIKCGIIPISEPAIVTTEGLRWNLKEEETSFTGLLSTSNIIDKDHATVKTNKPVVWTMTLPNSKD